MKKFGFALVATLSLCVFGLTGCGGGGGEPTVIEAPAATEDAAMEGMSDDEYAKAMAESMKQPAQ